MIANIQRSISFRMHTIQSSNKNQQKPNLSKARLNTLQNINLDHFYSKLGQKLPIRNQQKKKLSPIRQYETRLNISAQSWMIYDLLTQQYKRGWHPNKVSHFDGLLRIVIFFVGNLLSKNNQQILEYKIRLNYDLFNSEGSKKSRISPQKNQKIEKNKSNIANLGDNTIIDYKDLLFAMIMTEAQDLLYYSLISTGYLIYCQKQKQDLQKPYFYISQQKYAETYKAIFIDYVNQQIFLNKFRLTSTKINTKLELISTVSQICVIFRNCLRQKLFKQAVTSQKIVSQIKFQVGYNYWQDRQKKIISEMRPAENYFCILSYRSKRNFSTVAYNQKLNILIILEDSKFGMTPADLRAIQEWIIKVRKPIVNSLSNTKLLTKLKPLSNNIKQ